MPGIGNTLKEARARQGIDLAEVEQATKIRAKFLRALEEERWEVLPGTAYERSFLVTYARYLGLDAGALVDEYSHRPDQPTATDPIPDEMLPQPGMARGHALRRAALAVAGVAVLVVLAALAVGLPGDDGDRERGADSAAGVEAVEEDAAATTTTEPAAESDEQATAASSRVPVELRATGSVWVCLVDHNGEPLVDGETLEAGEERGPFRGRSFEVTVGNGAVEITADGEPVEIPDAAEPLGYRLTADGVSQLDAAEQPVCL